MRTILACAALVALAALCVTPSAAAAPDAVGCSPGIGGATICWVDAGVCGATVVVNARSAYPVGASPTCSLWP